MFLYFLEFIHASISDRDKLFYNTNIDFTSLCTKIILS